MGETMRLVLKGVKRALVRSESHQIAAGGRYSVVSNSICGLTDLSTKRCDGRVEHAKGPSAMCGWPSWRSGPRGLVQSQRASGRVRPLSSVIRTQCIIGCSEVVVSALSGGRGTWWGCGARPVSRRLSAADRVRRWVLNGREGRGAGSVQRAMSPPRFLD